MSKLDCPVAGWLRRFRVFMVERRYSRCAIKAYCIVARAFLRFLNTRHVALTSALPSHIDSYLKVQRSRYRRRWGHEPHDAGSWRTYHTSPIHLLFRLAQGQWPPRSKVRSQLASFRSHLEAEGHSRHSVAAYLTVAHRFLIFLAQGDVAPDRAQPADVSAYLKEEFRRYRRRHGRLPRSVVIWRCSLTGSVHALLRHVQGRWPPPLIVPWLERFKVHMRETCPSPGIREHYVCAAGQFLAFILKQGIALEAVESGHIEAFCRFKLTEYRKRHGRDPVPIARWLSNTRTPIHRLLRLVHGSWPPSPPEPILEQLRAGLRAARYLPTSYAHIERVARHFLVSLRAQGVEPERATPAHVTAYVNSRLARYRRYHRREPPDCRKWQRRYTGLIGRLLRLAQGRWPPEDPQPDPVEAFRRQLGEGYGRWLTDLHGFTQPTAAKNGHAARVFLDWLGERASPAALRQLSVADLDTFLAWRYPSLRRTTRRGVSHCLRSFLRYLYAAGHLDRDLAGVVAGPQIYWNETIPSALTEQQVRDLLATTRRDRTAMGRRDYAMILLLATYGLRAGEVVRLQLEDLDWRRERIRIRRSKRGGESLLPLTPAVGETLLQYLGKARPISDRREVFLRLRAPHGPFSRGAGLYAIVSRRLARAGIHVEGKHGPHALRYARAVSLLRAAVPLKTISDILGHRSSASTDGYLKLATEDLRQVGLDLPPEVEP